VTRPSVSTPSGQELYDAGWRQGALFWAKVSVRVTHLNPDGTVEQRDRPLKESESLVLASQDCDIVSNAEPYVEALFCEKEKSRTFLAKINRRSARAFVIDLDAGLVAQAKYRVSLTKESLATLKPKPWPASADRRERFAEWLAHRYDRPALPNKLVVALQTPITDLFERMAGERPDLVEAFNRVARQIRINRPDTDEPPFNLELIVLLSAEELTREESVALELLGEAMLRCVDRSAVLLAPDVRLVTADEMSLREYQETVPLYLEYLTFGGDEIVGALPPGRV
jgi:hypothetical protein